MRRKSLAIWTYRVVLLLGVVAFGTLALVFAIVTFAELFGESAGDNAAAVVVTALVTPICAALAAGCWWLFSDSFGGEPQEDGAGRL
jgi:hypothetical protein